VPSDERWLVASRHQRTRRGANGIGTRPPSAKVLEILSFFDGQNRRATSERQIGPRSAPLRPELGTLSTLMAEAAKPPLLGPAEPRPSPARPAMGKRPAGTSGLPEDNRALARSDRGWGLWPSAHRARSAIPSCNAMLLCTAITVTL
jgi:hypothetical protein